MGGRVRPIRPRPAVVKSSPSFSSSRAALCRRQGQAVVLLVAQFRLRGHVEGLKWAAVDQVGLQADLGELLVQILCPRSPSRPCPRPGLPIRRMTGTSRRRTAGASAAAADSAAVSAAQQELDQPANAARSDRRQAISTHRKQSHQWSSNGVGEGGESVARGGIQLIPADATRAEFKRIAAWVGCRAGALVTVATRCRLLLRLPFSRQPGSKSNRSPRRGIAWASAAAGVLQ